MNVKIIFTILLSSLLTLPTYANETKNAIDSMIVVVNEDLITNSEVDQLMKFYKLQLASQDITPPNDATLRKQLIQQLIDQKLQLQLANQLNVHASQADLDMTIKSIAKQNQVSVEDVYKRVAHEGMTANQYRHELSNQITIQKLQQQQVIPKLSITPKEIDQLKNKLINTNHTNTAYQVNDILIPITNEHNAAEIKQAKIKAEYIFNRLQKGESIQAIIKSNKKNKLTLTHTDLGLRQLDEIPSAFTAFVPNMKVNDYSSPIQTGNGFHILHLTAIQHEKINLAAKEAEAKEILFKQKFDTALQTWIKQLRQQAYIKNLNT